MARAVPCATPCYFRVFFGHQEWRLLGAKLQKIMRARPRSSRGESGVRCNDLLTRVCSVSVAERAVQGRASCTLGMAVLFPVPTSVTQVPPGWVSSSTWCTTCNSAKRAVCQTNSLSLTNVREKRCRTQAPSERAGCRNGRTCRPAKLLPQLSSTHILHVLASLQMPLDGEIEQV